MRYKVNDPESANQPPASAVTTTEDNSWSKQQDNEKSARTKQTRLIIVVGLLAVAVIALVVTLTLQTTIFGASGGDDGGAESKEMCQTEECIKTAARMIENLNKSVDPCEDFYDFACGGWIARNPIPQSESVWDQLISLHEELSQKLRLLLEEPDQPGEPRGVKMARAYYRTCLDTDSMEKLGMEPIYEVMARLKLPRDIPEDDLNPPKLDVAWLAGNAHRLLKLHLMVNFFISEDPRNGTLNRMMLEQVSPVLPDRHLLDPARFKSEIEEYKKYAKSMLELAGVGKRSSEFAQEIVDFSTQLAGILNTPEERRSPNHMFHDLSFQDLQMATDMNAQQWNWTTYINGVFNDTDVKIDTVKEKVIVVDMTYFQKLPQLLVLTPPSVIARYVWWCVYSTVAPLTMRRVRELGFEYSKRVYGLKENHPRWKVCVTNANNYFGMALTNMYAKRFFDEDQKQKALDMLMDIKEAFENMIGELDWMDASTRARAHRKLQAMRLWVGYPDWIHDPKKLDKHYKNSTVVEHNLLRTIMGLIGLETKTGLNALRKKPDKNRWVTSGTTANAYYSVILNSVTIPAGILYPPFYGNGLESINYGAMGAIMGHELTHGFDDQGRRYNEEGVLRQWWSDETLKHYSAKVECIIKQYNNYSVPELGHNFTVNGYNTQGENIADNGGLREAYRAYSKLRKRRPKQKIALPGLLDYSQDQLFFLGYANVWCGNQTLGAYKTNLVENVHAPNRFRVIGTLSNNEDFAKAWRCPRGSPMNPVHKCVLW